MKRQRSTVRRVSPLYALYPEHYRGLRKLCGSAKVAVLLSPHHHTRCSPQAGAALGSKAGLPGYHCSMCALFDSRKPCWPLAAQLSVREELVTKGRPAIGEIKLGQRLFYQHACC